MNKFGNEYVDKYIKKNVNKNTVSYSVFIWRHDLKVNERFETLEKAKAFRDEALRLCEVKRLEKVRADLQITDYPYNLINALEFDVKNVIEHFEERLDKVMNERLTPRERYVIKRVYEDHYTLEEVSGELEVTRERVRQVLIKALRNIKYFRNYFEIGEYAFPETLAKQSHENYIEAHKKYWTYESAKNFIEEYEEAEDELYRKIEKYKLENTTIEELDLTCRAYNCLKKASLYRYETNKHYNGIHTLKELLELSIDNLMCIRNLGKKSLKEIVDTVHKLGYKFKDEK